MHACTHARTYMTHAAQVHAAFCETGFDVWALGSGAAYRLHVPRTYSRLRPAKCRAAVRGKTLRITLAKASDAAWPFLRG